MTNISTLPTGLTLSDEERVRRTMRAYDLGWNQWSAFARSRGVTLFPAKPRSIAAFLSDFADTHSLNTVLLARTSIARMHKMASYEDPCADPLVVAILRAIRRNAASARQAKPLTQQVLEKMAPGLSERDDAMIRTMRDGLLRVSEAAALKWVHITFEEDGSGRLFIARSKTDIAGHGHYGYLGPDTIMALERIGPGEPNAPVFGVTADHITRWIRTLAKRAALGDGYSGHSPRVGMAVDLAEAGLNLPQLMQAGRWKSAGMPARYTEQVEAGRGAVAKFYQQQGEAPLY